MTTTEMPSFGGLSLDRRSGDLALNGVLAGYLAPQLTKVLAALMMATGNFMTKAALLDVLYWNRGEAGEPKSEVVGTYVCLIRQVITPMGYGIKSYYMRGYRLIDLKAEYGTKQAA